MAIKAKFKNVISYEYEKFADNTPPRWRMKIGEISADEIDDLDCTDDVSIVRTVTKTKYIK